MPKVMVAAIGIVGLALAIVLVYHFKPSPTSQAPEGTVPTDSQSLDQIESEETGSDGGASLGRLLGANKPAPSPVAFLGGPGPGETNAPDLSTPAVAVYSVLSLIDQGTTDELASCFVRESEDTMSMLYPRYLGRPVELAEVIEADDSAEVVWQATVHTAFSLDGKSRSPGETVTLGTKLLRVEDIWKILRLHDGATNGPF